MKIAQSVVGLRGFHASSSFRFTRLTRETLTSDQATRSRGGNPDPAGMADTLDIRRDRPGPLTSPQERTGFSLRDRSHSAPSLSAVTSKEGPPAVRAESLTMLLLRALFEELTGKKMQLLDLRGVVAPDSAGGAAESPDDQAILQIERTMIEHESEQTEFSAQGLVRTADGQEIGINLQVNMSRSFTRVLNERVQMQLGDTGRLKDPLVLDFTGDAVQLTRRDWRFDIDADGSEDLLSFVGPGAGFLALDANGDGVINNGSELFGALSGNGFADLALHDDDKNGWIDENDAIFSRLRIWSRDDEGRDRLVALGVRGVGALYLGHAATPFSLKDAENTLLGQVRTSGFFLRENGEPGAMYQVDLVA